jgi:flagellin-like hook-associated protein FlgL
LANLNLGRGTDGSPGQFVMRKIDGSAHVSIDLSGVLTVGQAITQFNNTMAAQGFSTVTMSLRADGRGLQITDTAIPPGGFEVAEVTDSDTTAADLGLSGPVNDHLEGTDLNPQPDFEVVESGPGSTIAGDLGLLGRFHGTLDGGDLDPLFSTATRVAQFNNGLGLELGGVRIASGDRTAIVDLSTAATVGEILSLLNGTGLPVEARVNGAGTGIEIYSTDDDRSLVVTSDTLRTAEELGIVGSPDLFGSLYLLRQALEQNNAELVRATNESIQGALDQILFERSATGSRQVRLEATDFRLLEQELNVTRLRSEYEDADILALSADLSRQEAVYQAALAAAARMIQPSLAQFLT